MSGVKGRSGGPRPNSGGKRPGAGRKPKPKLPVLDAGIGTVAATSEDHPAVVVTALTDGQTRKPLAFLELVMNDPTVPLRDRIRAAIAAAQYRHLKKGDGGKKDEQADKADQAAAKFTTAAPPRLISAR
jgi:phage terminase small subunit